MRGGNRRIIRFGIGIYKVPSERMKKYTNFHMIKLKVFSIVDRLSVFDVWSLLHIHNPHIISTEEEKKNDPKNVILFIKIT